MIVINQKQVKSLLPLEDIRKVVSAVEKAFGDYGKGMVQMPPKKYLLFPKWNGDLRIMPSFSEPLKMAGTKIVNVHPDNPKKGLKTVMASILLNDPTNGMPVALMDGTYITLVRTGAAGAVASKYLARKDASRLGVIGGGQQAISQICAIASVRRLRDIKVYDLNPKTLDNLEKVLKPLGIKFQRTQTMEEACDCDILVTTTPSRKPIVKKEWIKPGTHINAIGADAEGKEELDPEILKNSKIVIDDWAQASHSGEINVPVAKGLISEKDIYAGLGDIVAGKKPGRTDEKAITVFDSTGLGAQDLYTAAMVYKLAKSAKAGKDIELI